MKQLHRFRPSFLVKINPPKYLLPSKFNHTCLHKIMELEEDMDSLSLEAGNSPCDPEKRCAATPYVSQTDFGTTTIVEMLKTLVKEVCLYRDSLIPMSIPICEIQRNLFSVHNFCYLLHR